MVYNIKNRQIKVLCKNSFIELPSDLQEKINKNFEGIKKSGAQIFSKAKIKMTADEFKKHFKDYNTYLKENNLEIEFKKLYFVKKEKAIDDLNKLNKPKRYYLVPLLQIDMEQN